MAQETVISKDDDYDPSIKVHEIVNHLFLGGITSYGHLKFHNITAVVNLCCEGEIYLDEEQIRSYNLKDYLHLPIQDVKSENIQPILDKALPFIHRNIQMQRNVLVHCFEGKSRSCSVVLAYLMKHYNNMTLMDAYKHTKQIRSIVRPNESFWESLMVMERSLFDGKNSVSKKTIPTGPKSFICPFCEKDCGFVSENLYNHVKRKHSKEYEPFMMNTKSEALQKKTQKRKGGKN